MYQSKTFHKGDGLFGETAGVQCACNSLFALCWSRILKNSIWQSLDLDHMLVEGDKLYKTLNTLDMLMQISLAVGHVFLRNSIPSNDHVSMFFFMGSLTIAIIQKNQFQYVFHSDSRDERGLFVPNGKSVLLKFKDFYESEKYIQVAYLYYCLQYKDRTQQYFQAQLVQIHVDQALRLDILALNDINLRRLRRTSSRRTDNQKRREGYAKLV